MSTGYIAWDGAALTDINPFPNKPWFLRVCSTSLLKTMWENGEIARHEQFLLFPQCFLTIWRSLLKTMWEEGGIARHEQFLLFPSVF